MWKAIIVIGGALIIFVVYIILLGVFIKKREEKEYLLKIQQKRLQEEAEKARIAREAGEKARIAREAAEKARVEAQRQEEQQRRIERYLSTELIQRVINDCANYIIKDLGRFYRTSDRKEINGTWFVCIAENNINFGEYGRSGYYNLRIYTRGEDSEDYLYQVEKNYEMQKERYALIPRSDLSDLGDAISNAIVIQLKKYFSQYRYGKDSSIEIWYKDRIDPRKDQDWYRDGRKLAYDFTVKDIRYAAKNGNYVEARSW